jgi:hypothetical protein
MRLATGSLRPKLMRTTESLCAMVAVMDGTLLPTTGTHPTTAPHALRSLASAASLCVRPEVMPSARQTARKVARHHSFLLTIHP